MAKLNEKYETMVVFSLKNGEEQAETLSAKFISLIEESASLINTNVWGKRRLAYPINYETDGYYVLYTFDSTPDFPKELERVFNITEGVIRFLTVMRVEGPAKPAPEEKPDSPSQPDDGGSYAEPSETAEQPEESVAEAVPEQADDAEKSE